MNELLTAKQVAQILKVSTRQIWKLCSAGKLVKPLRLSRSVRWRAADLEQFLAAGCDMAKLAGKAVSA